MPCGNTRGQALHLHSMACWLDISAGLMPAEKSAAG
jgi:hypothetical protein